MKLWLDDARPAPEGWRWAKTAGEALTLLLRGGVKVASLDHDLGDEDRLDVILVPKRLRGYAGIEGFSLPRNGYEVLSALETLVGRGQMTARDLPREVRVHSANPVGAARMRECWAKIEETARTEAYLRRVAAERGATPIFRHFRDPFVLPWGAEVGYDSPSRREYLRQRDEAIHDALTRDQIDVHDADGRVGQGPFERFTVCFLVGADVVEWRDKATTAIVEVSCATGYAFCSPRDNFSRAEGRRLSLERALGL